MERQEIFEKLNEIFTDVLDLDECNLTDETSANDIEEWDSLSHIQLIVAIEKAFKIKFTSLEIMKWNNVGEMVDSMMEKLLLLTDYEEASSPSKHLVVVGELFLLWYRRLEDGGDTSLCNSSVLCSWFVAEECDGERAHEGGFSFDYLWCGFGNLLVALL